MKSLFDKVRSELRRGLDKCKCDRCGCMRGTLEGLIKSLPSLKNREAKALLKDIKGFYKELLPLEYSCFGCKFCIPAEAMTRLTREFPELASSTLLSCEFEVGDDWPTVDGEYTVLDKKAPVAVTTLADLKLEDKLAGLKPEGLNIIGKTETENIGIDKLVKNVITNPSIRYLILAGKEAPGHRSGATILALWKNGVDRKMRVIDSPGRRPVLKNLKQADIRAFRSQVEIEDLQGSANVRTITSRIKALAKKSEHLSATSGCGCADGVCHPEPAQPVLMPVTFNIPQAKPEKPAGPIQAKSKDPKAIKLDKAGYFVIMPSKKKKTILVEHYSYDNKLQNTIEGKNSRDLYLTIIENKWVSDLGHAAYLGKELARAEMSIKKGFKFVQDGA
jgi:tetrahydromethanopterin S-methyltransferase subunit A